MKKQTLSFIGGAAAIAMLFTGCGGKNSSSAINVITRENGSGTRGAFIELFGILEKGTDGSKRDRTTNEATVAGKTDVMLTNVSGDISAIGYVSTGSLNDSVKPLRIDNIEPTSENIKNGSYKIARPFNIAVKDSISESAQDFINFILSSEGQKIVENGYIPIDSDPKPFESSLPEGKVVVSGSSSVSPIMEKLSEEYMKIIPTVNIEVQMSDSSSGISGAINGTCDIGMASRDLTDEELSSLIGIPIAMDGIAVIVNPDNTISNLSASTVTKIFTGETTKWSEVTE